MIDPNELLKMPLSNIAEDFAKEEARRYLSEIALDGVWRATEEQLLNTGGYFRAQRRIGITNDEFVLQIENKDTVE